MQNKSKMAFLSFLVILMLAFGAIIRPFLLPLVFAALVVIICNPIYQFLLGILKKRYLAAPLATLIVLVLFIAPFGIVVGIIVSNIAEVTGYVISQVESGQIAQAIDNASLWLTSAANQIPNLLPPDFSLKAAIMDVLRHVSVVVYQYSPKFLTATANVAGGIILLIIFILVFFAEGSNIYQTIMSLLPLDEEHKQILAREMRFVISATFLGMIATSVAQGVLIGIGFWIAGISNPVVWGLVAVGVTLIPVIGGPLMYLPAAAALFAGGDTGWGIFILLYGIGLVSMIDNVIKPLVMRGKVNVHPLLLALSLIGGGIWLGPVGIIAGPLVVVLMLAMLKIYQREFA